MVAISPQLPDKSLSTVEKDELQFEVLSDVGQTVARQFGLVFPIAEVLRPIYKNIGADLPAYIRKHWLDEIAHRLKRLERKGSIRRTA